MRASESLQCSSNRPARKLIATKITFLESFRKWPLGVNEWHSRGKVFASKGKKTQTRNSTCFMDNDAPKISQRCCWDYRRVRESNRKGKGRDIGYALASGSCEGANQRGVCTITALDAITAFAVPNPNCPSLSSRFFRVWSFSGSPQRTDHPAYFGSANLCFD